MSYQYDLKEVCCILQGVDEEISSTSTNGYSLRACSSLHSYDIVSFLR